MASGGTSVINQSTSKKNNYPKYLKAAIDDIGTKEFIVKDGKKRSNPKVEAYALKSANTKIDAIQVPWCAYWVGAKLEDAGYNCTKKGNARSYLQFGSHVPKKDWRPGDIAVFWRGRHDDGVTGHVAIILDWDGHKLRCIGGNQGDMVCVQEFGLTKLLDVRRPRGVLASKTALSLSSGGTNELAVKPAVDHLIPDPIAIMQKLPDPSHIKAITDDLRSPLEMLSSAKPWIMFILSGLTIACILYGLAWRIMDHTQGRNT